MTGFGAWAHDAGVVRPAPLDPVETLKDLVGQVRSESDLITQAVAAGELMAAMRESTSELSKIRRAALRGLWGAWTLEEIADALGITRSRVEQILK